MTIALQDYSARKVMYERDSHEPKQIDFKYESITNPVPENWRWCFKRGQGNLMNVCTGTVLVKDGWGCVVKRRRFISRWERNNIVNSFERQYRCRRLRYYICVEFDD